MTPAAPGRMDPLERGEFANCPGKLEGDALERALQARALRAHLQARQAYADWEAGRPPDPEVAFWMRDDPA